MRAARSVFRRPAIQILLLWFGVMAVFLQMKNLVKYYEERRILHGVSLDVRQGEMLCILGPSGCGKTTLLRCLAGLETPDHGEVFLKDADITMLSPEKRHFGFVFQNYALFPNLTVTDNIGYGLRGPGWPRNRRDERVAELLALVTLEEKASHYPGQLSGGQQQRVALARALAPDPALLLLDEPLSALDAQVRSQLREDLRKIQRRLGITAILVTHDQQEALALADRIVVMQDGRLEQVAGPGELYQQPRTRFVAEFIGSMNVLSLPECNSGRPFGVRYEDVRISEATEAALGQPHSFVGRVESCRLLGAFCRLELLLNDQTTSLYADIPAADLQSFMGNAGALVAVSLPQARWCLWEEQ